MLNYKKILFLFNRFTLNDLLKNSTHQERVVEKGGAWGWGWVDLEIVGAPIKSNKKNVKKGNLPVNNIFYQNYLSMEFCTI